GAVEDRRRPEPGPLARPHPPRSLPLEQGRLVRFTGLPRRPDPRRHRRRVFRVQGVCAGSRKEMTSPVLFAAISGAARPWMVEMLPLTVDDLLPLEEYATRRKEFFDAQRRYVDRYRRVRIGPKLMLIFENRQTLWFRVQEV